MDEAKLQILWDRQEIGATMLRFGRALDTHDWPLYEACFTDPFEVDFFDLTGRPATTVSAAAWTEFARRCLDRLTVMHQYSNFTIDVHGDTANGIFYHVSRHYLPNKHGEGTYYQYGWYTNTFVRTETDWKITTLKHEFQWCEGNPTLIDQTDPDWIVAAQNVFG